MLIPIGSFLRNIPQALNVREATTLDAIRVAAEMVECSLVRAEACALTISQHPPHAFSSGWITALLTDLWGAILHLNISIRSGALCQITKWAEMRQMSSSLGWKISQSFGTPFSTSRATSVIGRIRCRPYSHSSVRYLGFIGRMKRSVKSNSFSAIPTHKLTA